MVGSGTVMAEETNQKIDSRHKRRYGVKSAENTEGDKGFQEKSRKEEDGSRRHARLGELPDRDGNPQAYPVKTR